MFNLKTICVIVLALGLFSPICYSEDYAPADGWIDLFDGETLFGWLPIDDGNWCVEDGLMSCARGDGGWIATTSQFKNFEMVVRLRLTKGTTSGILLRAKLDSHWSENGSGAVLLDDAKGKWQDISIRAEGGNVVATVNGKEETISTANDLGHIGFLYHARRNKESQVEIEYAKLRPIGMKPLMNGKDLEGWNILPGRKSVFTVIDGALNIKDGHGQIETEGTYSDFILQLDIISNGDRLNSGVFFRSPVGKFWHGYESQVRNEWQGNDRSKPVDYGTGGIYAIQNARRVVSSDHKWFTKTILANDNHIAVWIDGYMVSDFTDTRPLLTNGNSKAGYLAAAGTIHLQGHDPTTDLSFKNINIQTY